MTVERFRPEHVMEIAEHADDVANAGQLDAASPEAYTLRVNGEVLMCGGVAELGPDKGMLWSYIAPAALQHPVIVHRSVLRFLSLLSYRRLEAYCKCDSQRANRWLETLGFTLEAPRMAKWAPDGSDYSLWAKT